MRCRIGAVQGDCAHEIGACIFKKTESVQGKATIVQGLGGGWDERNRSVQALKGFFEPAQFGESMAAIGERAPEGRRKGKSFVVARNRVLEPLEPLQRRRAIGKSQCLSGLKSVRLVETGKRLVEPAKLHQGDAESAVRHSHTRVQTEGMANLTLRRFEPPSPKINRTQQVSSVKMFRMDL